MLPMTARAGDSGAGSNAGPILFGGRLLVQRPLPLAGEERDLLNAVKLVAAVRVA